MHNRQKKGMLLFAIFVFCFSCEKEGTFVGNCSDCTADEPNTAKLEIKTDNQYSAVVIDIYEGDLEDGIIYDTYETYLAETTRTVPLNKRYTVTATYTISGINYIAVNSATPRVKYDEDQCEEPCYYVYDRAVNLKLKYTK